VDIVWQEILSLNRKTQPPPEISAGFGGGGYAREAMQGVAG